MQPSKKIKLYSKKIQIFTQGNPKQRPNENPSCWFSIYKKKPLNSENTEKHPMARPLELCLSLSHFLSLSHSQPRSPQPRSPPNTPAQNPSRTHHPTSHHKPSNTSQKKFPKHRCQPLPHRLWKIWSWVCGGVRCGGFYIL